MTTPRSEIIQQAKILKALISLSEADIILNNFVYSFMNKTIDKGDGVRYLHGNFNLGGTVSGRLSSSKVNLQNLPSSGSKYAKLVKQGFVAPEGWILCGADFSSLEDRISALTTKDPNKLKVYEDGYDGHCLRAFAYFPDKMSGIVDTVSSINSIETKYPELRQESKAPTFLLTYQGTYHGLMNNVGLSKKVAQAIEKAYHEMYIVSDEWVQKKLEQASHDGYVTVAFGLRVRTPILKQTILNNSKTPYEAQAEGRTAGNALGQSYGLLNNRSGIDFHNRLMDSRYKYDIKPIAHIHDAQYFLVRKDITTLKWFNDNLVETMEWQQLPEIQHPAVKLGGNVEVYWPNWATVTTLPNNATEDEIRKLFK